MNQKYHKFFLTWFNKFLRVPYPGTLVTKGHDHYFYKLSHWLENEWLSHSNSLQVVKNHRCSC
jgi:hypothetical protein